MELVHFLHMAVAAAVAKHSMVLAAVAVVVLVPVVMLIYLPTTTIVPAVLAAPGRAMLKVLVSPHHAQIT
jgi:hypothetical protein